eukprot:gene4115-14219_t
MWPVGVFGQPVAHSQHAGSRAQSKDEAGATCGQLAYSVNRLLTANMLALLPGVVETAVWGRITAQLAALQDIAINLRLTCSDTMRAEPGSANPMTTEDCVLLADRLSNLLIPPDIAATYRTFSCSEANPLFIRATLPLANADDEQRIITEAGKNDATLAVLAALFRLECNDAISVSFVCSPNWQAPLYNSLTRPDFLPRLATEAELFSEGEEASFAQIFSTRGTILSALAASYNLGCGDRIQLLTYCNTELSTEFGNSQPGFLVDQTGLPLRCVSTSG